VIFLRKKEKHYDFRSVGQAIKEARIKQGMTREELAEKLDMAVRYLADIENVGQHPSIQYFYELVTMFNISVDEFFYTNVKPAKSTRRRQLDNLLDNLDDNDLIIVQSVVRGITQAKNKTEP
jgi:transcriptional regulator with XRE-family HTH domain